MLGSHQIAPAPKAAVKSQPGRVTAEWIDYVIQTPGKPAQTIRREIFDLVGPATRAAGGAVPGPQMTDVQKLDRSLSLMDTVEILPIAAQFSPAFILHSLIENPLSNRESILSLIRESGAPGSNEFIDAMSKSKPPVAEQLNNLAFERFSWRSNKIASYLDQINVLTSHKQPRIIASGSLAVEEGFDIVCNRIGVYPMGLDDRFRTRLEQGVSDTNVEAELAGPENDVRNTANAFAESIVRDTKWVTVRNDHDSGWRELDIPRDVRARVQADLTKGYAVVLPTRTSHSGACAGGCWWRIDPQTGETLGIGSQGWGQTAGEYVRGIRIAATLVQMSMCMLAVNPRKRSGWYYMGACVAVGFLKGYATSLGGADLFAGILALGGDVIALIVLATKADWDHSVLPPAK